MPASVTHQANEDSARVACGETRAIADHCEKTQVKLHVEVLTGPEKGQLYTITPDRPFIVGTSAEATLVVSDDTVSRLHLELSCAEGATVRARDLGSTNGCFHEGAQFRQLDVPVGSVLRLGQTELRLIAEDSTLALLPSEATRFGDLLGRSLEMRQIFAVLERASRTDTTVLITGETGTGKEVVAESLHRASARSAGPFVVVDCSSMPSELVESELFGHVAGSFTGAISDRVGAFREADGGTIFLDELGELPIELQPRLLRVLESRTVKPVGSNQAIPVNVRIVAATNRNLEKLVRERRFRSDLYFRLAVIRIALPALRDRREDIPMLARHFARRFSSEQRIFTVRSQTMAALISHSWPGNIRELRNVIQQAATLSSETLSLVMALSSDTLPPTALGFEPYFDMPFREARRDASLAFELAYVKHRVTECGGNISQTAKEIGLHRNMVRRILNREPRPDDAKKEVP